MFYAYIYRDPRHALAPFYVGKGKADRAWHHLHFCHNREMQFKLQKMKAEGVEPDIEIIPALCEQHAFFLEECLIQVLGRKDLGAGPLLNRTNGGDGATGRIVSDAERAWRSDAIRGTKNPNFGGVSDTHRENIRKSRIGTKASDEARANMSASRTGKPHPRSAPASQKVRDSLSKAATGKRWWNNGVITKFAHEQPGADFRLGRLL